MLEFENIFNEEVVEKVKDKFDNMKKYDMVPKCTQQFRHCGNPFRVDTYKMCDFGCKYCFANSSNLLGRNNGWQNGNIDKFRRFMKKCFELNSDGTYKYETNNLSMELVRRKVPMHCGGLSDPFQTREWEHKITLELIKISKEYNYPLIFSTKGIIDTVNHKEWWDELDPRLHAFQLSLISVNDEYLRKYETNTPHAKERIEFAKELRRRGFWTSIRIQPCIDIDEAKQVVEELSPIVNYITVEHLKIDAGNDTIKNLFWPEVQSGRYHRQSTMMFEMNNEEKIKDIQLLKSVSKCPIGVGDNSLHYLSDSDCCCGIDTISSYINSKDDVMEYDNVWDNWLQYNSTYIAKHGQETADKCWLPQQSCVECFFKGSFGNSVEHKDIKDLKYKDFVDEYVKRHPEFMRPVLMFEDDIFEGID